VLKQRILAQNRRKIAAKSHSPIYVHFCDPFYAFLISKNESHIQKWKRKLQRHDIQMCILNVGGSSPSKHPQKETSSQGNVFFGEGTVAPE
jgi:hypothetical protein